MTGLHCDTEAMESSEMPEKDTKIHSSWRFSAGFNMAVHLKTTAACFPAFL